MADEAAEAPGPPDPPDDLIIVLDMLKQISNNNAELIRMLKRRLTYDPTVILALQKSNVDAVRAKRLKEAKTLIDRRRAVAKKTLGSLGGKRTLAKNLKKTLAAQAKARQNLDDRLKITRFAAAMANLAVSLGYDKNDVARWLGVTSKHMKMSVLSERFNPRGGRPSVLQTLDWFHRCPNPSCGVLLSDYFERRIPSFRGKKSDEIESAEDYEIELLKPTSYQAQILELLKE